MNAMHSSTIARLKAHGPLPTSSMPDEVRTMREILDVLRAVDDLHARLRNDDRDPRVSERTAKKFSSIYVRRAGRVFVEELWEKPRLSTREAKARAGKYSTGSLYSPRALQRYSDPEAKAGGLRREHVVDAVAVADILTRLAHGRTTSGARITPMKAARIAVTAMQHLSAHVVVLNAPAFDHDEVLRRDEPRVGSVPQEDVDALFDHFTGERVLDEHALLERIWCRYLRPELIGLAPGAELKPKAARDMSWTLDDLRRPVDEQ